MEREVRTIHGFLRSKPQVISFQYVSFQFLLIVIYWKTFFKYMHDSWDADCSQFFFPQHVNRLGLHIFLINNAIVDLNLYLKLWLTQTLCFSFYLFFLKNWAWIVLTQTHVFWGYITIQFCLLWNAGVCKGESCHSRLQSSPFTFWQSWEKKSFYSSSRVKEIWGSGLPQGPRLFFVFPTHHFPWPLR